MGEVAVVGYERDGYPSLEVCEYFGSALGRPVLLIPESGRDADFAPPMEQRGGSRSQQPRKPTREEYEAQVAARRAIRRGYGAPEGT